MSSPSKVQEQIATDSTGTSTMSLQAANTTSDTEPRQDQEIPITAVAARPNTSIVTDLVPVLNLNNNSSSDNPVDLKPPNSLSELLKLSSSLQSTPRDGTTHQPMEDEKQQFLVEVLNQMSVNVGEEMSKMINTLSCVENDAQNYVNYEALLDELVDLVCAVDIANLFYQVGGLDMLVPLLLHSHAGLRWRAAQVVAVCCQNNPYCAQSSACNIVFTMLMDLASKDNDMTVRTKALSAISAIIRDNPTGVSRFRLGNGFAILKEALEAGNEKIASKGAFLLISLCDTDDSAKDELVKLGIVENLISLALLTSDLVAEYFLRALLSITHENPVAISECLKPKYGLKRFINKIITTKGEDEACKELVECALELRERFDNKVP